MERITSNSNNKIKHVRELLAKGKTRKETGTFVTEGFKMVGEAAALSLTKEIYVSDSGLEDERIRNIVANAEHGHIYQVSDALMKDMSDTETPQGILAVTGKAEHGTLESLLAQERVKLLILEDVRDPGNLGTMIRTAEGAGMTAIIMSKGTVDMYSPKVVRSTMGSLFRVPCFYVEDLAETLAGITAAGITVYAAHLRGQKFFDEIDYPAKCGVMIGNEANGLSDRIADLASEYVKIPMEGKLESLNASVAAALMMYESRK